MNYLNIVIKNIKAFIKIAWKREKAFFFWIMLNFIASGVFAYFIILSPRIIVEMAERRVFDLPLFVGVFGSLMISGLLTSISKIYYTPAGYRIRYHLLEEMMRQNLVMPLEKYESPEIQDKAWTVFRSVISVDGVQGFYLNFGMLFGNVAPIFVSVGLLLEVSPWISFFIFGWFVFYSIIYIRDSRKKDALHREYNPKYQDHWYWNDIAIDFANAKEIRVYGLVDLISQKLDQLILLFKQLAQKTSFYLLRAGLLNDFYQFARNSLIYGILAYSFLKGDIALSLFTSYIVMLNQLNNAMKLSIDNLLVVVSMHENFKSMFEYLETEQEDKAKDSINTSSWVIEFKDVTFKYPQTERYIYENLNLKLEKGKKIAIVGLNGSGKSTLIKLLLRLYKPSSGVILLNGVDIQLFDEKAYFDLFSAVFQEVNVFAFNLKENLVFDRDVDDSILNEALKHGGLSELENKLDHEMTHYISENGIGLSGGQAQKLMMVRAVLSQRPVMILDEPTSALDALAEYEYYSNINKYYADKTILFVSHRLASTRFCDEIILVGESRILEQGSHTELMEKQGVYNKLFQIQAKYYQEGEMYEATN